MEAQLKRHSGYQPVADPTTMIEAMKIDWDKVDHLLPVIIQDYQSAEVLMLGYMNEEALAQTFKSGKVTFFSRTKSRLWTKGESSGNFLMLVDYAVDCDQDTLLLLVNPMGATCHLGTVSCFESVSQQALWPFFARLEQLIEARKQDDPESSYTASLYASGTKRIAQKVGEEGVEVALAGTVNDREELTNEMADLLYHTTVLLRDQSLSWADVLQVLQARHQQ